MSRTKNAAELCALLVDENYGELSSRIFTLLLRRGRQTIISLAQYTRLPLRHLRHGLAVLLQQNLIYYHHDADSRVTYYEANQDASYLLLRSGKIIEFIYTRYGASARDIARNLLYLGHAKIGELLDKTDSDIVSKIALKAAIEEARRANAANEQGNEDGVENGIEEAKHEPFTNGVQNGSIDHDHTTVPKDLPEALCHLLEAGIIEPVVRRMFDIPSDIYNQVEKEITRDHFGGSLKGTKQKDELKHKVMEKLRDLRSEGRAWQSTGTKRSLNGNHHNGGEKRRKLTNGDSSINGGSHGHHIESDRFDRELIVRINYEKCDVVLRNQQLVSLVAHEVGETASHIYAELLRLLEDQTPRCRLDPIMDEPPDVDDLPGVSTAELFNALSESVDPTIGIGRVKAGQIDTSPPKNSQKTGKRKFSDSEAALEGNASSDEDEDNGSGRNHVNGVDKNSGSHIDDPFTEPLSGAPAVQPPGRRNKVTFQEDLPKPISREDKHTRMYAVRNHLAILEEHARHYVKKSSGGSGEWTVNFTQVLDSIRESELDTFIHQSFGPIGKRIAQILRQKGKLEEKQIQKFGLLKLRDVRTKLVEMQMAGFVDVQEIPRDNSRIFSNRTLFFWFFDVERVTMIVLDKIYKTMSRSLQVLQTEKHKEIDVLTLAERSDVKGQEEEMLSQTHLNSLQKIRDKEERIYTQIGRLDELVGVFRDF